MLMTRSISYVSLNYVSELEQNFKSYFRTFLAMAVAAAESCKLCLNE